MGDIGLAIRCLREGEGLSLRDLAKKTGISASTLSRAENGHVNDMRFGDVKAIAEAFGMTLDELFIFDIEPCPHCGKNCPTCGGKGWISQNTGG